jgi:DNA-binding transcriptional LysR family regulator
MCAVQALDRAVPERKHTAARLLTDWDGLRVVLAVHRGGSLSAAARTLGVDHTTVARHISAFERHLGSPLFERGPNGFVANSLGESVIATAEHVEDEVTGLLRRIEGAADYLSGIVKLTTTASLASLLFAPALGRFIGAHPGLRIELVGDNRNLDLSRREADLAVRLARPEAPALITRRLGDYAMACYAAIDDPRPFDDQTFLAYEDAFDIVAPQRYLSALMPPDRMALRTNTTEALIQATRAGLGCAVLPCLVAERDPALRRVPAPRAMPVMTLWLVYHEDLRRSPRVRAAAAFVIEAVAARQADLVPAAFPFDPP